MSGFLAFGLFLGCYRLVLVKLSKTSDVLSSCYFVFFAFKALRFPSVSFGDLNAAQILQSVEEMQVNKIITVHIL